MDDYEAQMVRAGLLQKKPPPWQFAMNQNLSVDDLLNMPETEFQYSTGGNFSNEFHMFYENYPEEIDHDLNFTAIDNGYVSFFY